MAPCPSAFVVLSGSQVFWICLITCAAVALSFMLGLDEGKHRGRRQGLLFARDLDEKRREELRNSAWLGGSDGE